MKPIPHINLISLEPSDREQFILDNQKAFLYGAVEEFGPRDDHFEEGGEIISRRTIENAIDGEKAETYRILYGGKYAGGVVLRIDKENRRGDLELLFVNPEMHSMGLGYAAWLSIEAMHPEVDVWETCTPYFEKRNIHFYVNRCGFHIVEFFNAHHPDPHDPELPDDRKQDEDFDGMFRFEKRIR
ncbi:MAG: GNAT family N-acetyltransferase [Oscillospiraceae bacterium]|nr:GNAT family N-acetyltransferase [Oscillospiraceae bacterium]